MSETKTEVEDCKHGLPPDWCATCKYGSPLPAQEGLVKTFLAKFPGHCDECKDAIDVGDRISYTTKQRYIHRDCFK